MRHLATIIVFSVLSAVACMPSSAADAARLWRVCAQSELIVAGTISVPLSNNGRIEAGSDGYTPVFIRIDKTIKGPRQASLVVRQYVKGDRFDVAVRQLAGLDGRRAVVFLVSASNDGVNRDWYFAPYRDGLALLSPDVAQPVSAEVMRQQSVLRSWKPQAAPGAAVSAAIRRMLDPSTELAAFRELENLGMAAVPAMIDQMDDRRGLPLKRISLVNHDPHAFEALRHYGPEKVVDAVAAILNQITHEHFGFIYNGATDTERARTVAGWRTYQDVLLNHKDWLKAD